MSAKVYFFKAGNYLRYDVLTDVVDGGYPLGIGAQWPGMSTAGFASNIDAALDWGDGKVFFFKGPEYVRYDVAAEAVDSGYPLSIAAKWPGMATAGFGDAIGAVLNWGDGKIYFFKGSKYLRYDMAADKVDDGYPLSIADNWHGMESAGFASDIDAAINWGNGKIFFFKGGNYVRYDIASEKVDDGYPLSIASFWPGFAAAGFGAGVKAPVQLSGTAQSAVLTGDLSNDFFAELKRVGTRLACHPARLLLVMYSESEVKADAMHPSGSAVGINQLTTGSLPTVGWTQGVPAFRQLTASQQLPYVEKYFARFRALDLDSVGRLYQLNYVPATARPGQGPETVLTEHNGVLAAAYDSNSILDANHDGKITIGDLETTALRHRSKPRWKEIEKRMQ